MGAKIKMEDTLHFGKYKGRKVEDIAQEDPQYLVWCLDNIDWFKMTPADSSLIRQYADEDAYLEDYDLFIDPYDFCD